MWRPVLYSAVGRTVLELALFAAAPVVLLSPILWRENSVAPAASCCGVDAGPRWSVPSANVGRVAGGCACWAICSAAAALAGVPTGWCPAGSVMMPVTFVCVTWAVLPCVGPGGGSGADGAPCALHPARRSLQSARMTRSVYPLSMSWRVPD